MPRPGQAAWLPSGSGEEPEIEVMTGRLSTGEPSTGANPVLLIHVPQTRLRVPVLQHKQLLWQAEVLGDQKRPGLENG